MKTMVMGDDGNGSNRKIEAMEHRGGNYKFQYNDDVDDDDYKEGNGVGNDDDEMKEGKEKCRPCNRKVLPQRFQTFKAKKRKHTDQDYVVQNGNTSSFSMHIVMIWIKSKATQRFKNLKAKTGKEKP